MESNLKKLRAYWSGGYVRNSWTVRIQQSRFNSGFMFIGVCDSLGRCAWGLHPYSGLLYRISKLPDGRLSFGVPPPADYPDGNLKQVVVNQLGEPTNLRGSAQGATIECIFNAAAGVLAFRINDGPLLLALSGFPEGEPVRRWALIVDKADRVVIEA